MPYACKICVMRHGLRGSDIGKLPKTEEELFDHLEKVHGIKVDRPPTTDAAGGQPQPPSPGR